MELLIARTEDVGLIQNNQHYTEYNIIVSTSLSPNQVPDQRSVSLFHSSGDRLDSWTTVYSFVLSTAEPSVYEIEEESSNQLQHCQGNL